MNFPKHIHRRMNEQVLWTLVNHTIQQDSNQDTQIALLIESLANWKVEHILKFELLFWKLMEKANTQDLLAATQILHSDVDENTFLYFRSWLLLQGQAIFKKVLNDPEYLATLPQIKNRQSFYLCPTLIEVSKKAYFLKTGRLPSLKLITQNTSRQVDFRIDKQTLIDTLPLLCRELGWGNEIPQGSWQTDDLKSLEGTGKS